MFENEYAKFNGIGDKQHDEGQVEDSSVGGVGC